MKKKRFFDKGLFTIFCTCILRRTDVLFMAVMMLCVLMVLDYVSGILAAKKEALEHPGNQQYGWNSKKGIIGIYKKVGYIFTILVAYSTDYLIYKLVNEAGILLQSNTIIGLMVSIWIIINELLSILENVGRMGVALPQFLRQVLSDLQKGVEE